MCLMLSIIVCREEECCGRKAAPKIKELHIELPKRIKAKSGKVEHTV